MLTLKILKIPRSIPFFWWWIFAIVVRIIAAATHTHWFHPDEWCQTFEPANIIAHGFGFHSQELGLHLRNLSWPTLLAAVLKLSDWLAPLSVHFRIFCLNLFCGALDLLILWGWIQCFNRDPLLKQLSLQAKNWSLALLLLPWFTVYESVSPRIEHLSEIALWATLGCLANQFWILSGLAGVAIFAFRYPSALLTVGIFLPLGVEWVKTKNFRALIQVGMGMVCGLILFGLADGLIYGRPWESFWMYLQYNVFTGSSHRVFGKQGISEYLEIFLWNWAKYKIYVPLALGLLCCAFYGTARGLKKLQPWAICLVVYLVGHFLVPHKEGRFMIPIETLSRWAAFVGVVLLSKEKSIQKRIQEFRLKNLLRPVVALLLFVNGLAFLHALRADFFRERGTYREVSSHLNEANAAGIAVCGVMTPGELGGFLLPWIRDSRITDPNFSSKQDGSSKSFPLGGIPVGGINVELDRKGYPYSKESEITWMERQPNCHPEDKVLLHLHHADEGWEDAEGCSLLRSGVLHILPHEKWKWAIQHHWVVGPWYLCPQKILGRFRSQKVAHVYSQSFGHISELPPYGIGAQELEDLGHRTVSPPSDGLVPTL